MKISTRWAVLLAACGAAAFVSWLERKRHNEKQALKADLHEWENEGGNLASPPKATNRLVTTGSA